jgi:hypothetical protein
VSVGAVVDPRRILPWNEEHRHRHCGGDRESDEQPDPEFAGRDERENQQQKWPDQVELFFDRE